MQEEYHLLVDAIQDYAIYLLDASGLVTTWNVGAERMKGYSEKEVLGKHFSLFFVPEDRDKGKPERELEAARARGRYEEEGWRIRKDGSRFWANIILTPVISENGDLIGFAKVTRDLTEKKGNEELYLLLVNQVKEYAIFMVDTTGNVLTWNEGAQRIKGYTAPEIIGKHISAFYSPEDNDENKVQRGLETALKTGNFEDEGWRIRKDGSRFWASVVITPIYKDRHIGFAKVTRDLTRRKEIEQLERANTILKATNKELERFAYIASHDLKEPLRKISTFADRVLHDKEKSPAETHQDYLRKIVSSSSRMQTIMDDVLNFASLSKEEHFERYSLNQVMSEAVDMLEHTVEEKQAIVRHNPLPEAIIMPAQMRQLFQNLLSNAIKFAKKGVPPEINIVHTYIKKEGAVTDGVWPADQYLEIIFKDNGIGFEREYAEKIFDIFERLHNKAAYEGTGLGLAICRKIAESHGGTITAKSTPGKGSEFTIVIPA